MHKITKHSATEGYNCVSAVLEVVGLHECTGCESQAVVVPARSSSPLRVLGLGFREAVVVTIVQRRSAGVRNGAAAAMQVTCRASSKTISSVLEMLQAQLEVFWPRGGWVGNS